MEKLIQLTDEIWAKGQSVGYLDENGQYIKVSDAIVDIEEDDDSSDLECVEDYGFQTDKMPRKYSKGFQKFIDAGFVKE